jgi:molybdenum cofactor cytidylyltransferase
VGAAPGQGSTTHRPPTVGGVILAAGPSRRFHDGRPKQLVPFEGEPLVRRVARAALASRLRQVLVVVGHRGPALAAVLAGLAVELVDNCDFARGQSSSVRCGLAHLEPGVEAAVFIPADQPLVTAAFIDQLIEAFGVANAPIVVPRHGGQRGSPVLVARTLFAELATITGDEGARQLFSRHEDKLLELEVDDPHALRDIDTVAEYEELLALAAARRR